MCAPISETKNVDGGDETCTLALFDGRVSTASVEARQGNRRRSARAASIALLTCGLVDVRLDMGGADVEVGIDGAHDGYDSFGMSCRGLAYSVIIEATKPVRASSSLAKEVWRAVQSALSCLLGESGLVRFGLTPASFPAVGEESDEIADACIVTERC